MKQQILVNSPEVPSRLKFGQFANRIGLNGRAAEIGVNLGVWANSFLSQWKGELLYLVDPYIQLPVGDYKDAINQRTKNHEDRFQRASATLAKYHTRIEFVRMMSEEASEKLPDDLDLVHIDANHDYAYVVQDIELWWPKVKSGGILCGHDMFTIGWLGVTNAVIEFADSNDLQVHVVPPEVNGKRQITSAPSWWVRKP